MTSCRRERSPYGLALRVVENGADPGKLSGGNEITAEIGREIVFDLSILDTFRYEGWKPLHHDLMLVCAAVEFADRRRKRRLSQWSRRLQITLPVLDLTVWRQTEVGASLRDALRHLTGDEWHFFFVQAQNAAVNGTRQRTLPFENGKEFAIAYSNGLDSRCVSGLLDTEDFGIRVRVTKNKNRVRDGERPFEHIPFAVRPASPQESSVRSRGFKFAGITAIAAHISGVCRIVVPESGQGALGPVLLPLHNVYGDYRNCPTFFRKMERFIQALLGYPVTYEQPRLWHTKAETIKAYLALPGKLTKSVLNTRSCWQQRWNARLNGKLGQCGLCAACLLRRMSMHAAYVNEPADTYNINDLTAARYKDAIPQSKRKRLSGNMVEYGCVGARHLQQLAEMARLPDSALRPHVFEIARATSMSERDTTKALRRLLLSHADEWRDFVSAQGQHSFIASWTSGGRYG